MRKFGALCRFIHFNFTDRVPLIAHSTTLQSRFQTDSAHVYPPPVDATGMAMAEGCG